MSNPKLRYQFNAFIENNGLPKVFIDTIDQHYQPLAQWVNSHRPHNRTWIIGINGAQGTGKSTLSAVLKVILKEDYGCNTAIISLDDLYLSQAGRKKLAQTIHPLLQTRGVPGTHDVNLGIQLLDKLVALKENEILLLPRFNKATDNRLPKSNWEKFTGPANVIIFEGWCVGSRASSEKRLIDPINTLEAREDKNGLWRHYVNNQLSTVYAKLFNRNDALIMLRAPDFSSIQNWRWEQEQKLSATVQVSTTKTGVAQVMTKAGIRRFIQHFERLTQQNLSELPKHADIVFDLNKDHQIIRCNYKSQGPYL